MLKSMLLILTTSYFAWYMERFETSMIYPFDASLSSPAVAGEDRLTDTRHATSDGEQLVVWRAEAEPGKPTVLYLPGNSGSLKDRAERFSELINQGYGVTAVGYRGSSGSTGQPEELALTDDAIAIAQGERGRPLILYGESLGTAIAIKLAGRGIGDAVVLEAPFTSISDLVASQYPDEDLERLLTQRWESLDRVTAMRQPLLVIHGDSDLLVPLHMGRTIFEEAGSTRKKLWVVPGRGHNGLWTTETQAVLYDFLESL